MTIVNVVNIITIFVYLAASETSCEVTHSHMGLQLENIVLYVFSIPFTFI